MAVENPMDNIEPGIKVAAQMSPEPSEEDLQFARQMGVEYVVLWTDGAHANYDYFMSRREIFENAGLKIYGFGNGDVHCQAALVLNLPNTAMKRSNSTNVTSVIWEEREFPTPHTPTWRMASGAPIPVRPAAALRHGLLIWPKPRAGAKGQIRRG